MVNGYLVNVEQAMAASIADIHKIDPAAAVSPLTLVLPADGSRKRRDLRPRDQWPTASVVAAL